MALSLSSKEDQAAGPAGEGDGDRKGGRQPGVSGGYFDNGKSTEAVRDRDRVQERRRWAFGPVKAPNGRTENLLLNGGERGT